MRASARIAVPLVLGMVAAACGGSSGGGSSDGASGPGSGGQGKQVTVATQRVSDLGTVLVDGKGRTLYMFPPDHREKVTCTHVCAGTWPPLTVPRDARPRAGDGAKASLLGTVPNPNPSGGRVVTYHGWPLYTYVGDVQPGQANGQALDLNGGYWYVLRPSGKVVKTDTSESDGGS